MKTVKLYTTLGCHLCEQAAAMLDYLGNGLTVVPVEISEDDGLMECYGVRIPVVGHADSELELGWPFDLPQLQAFIERLPAD